MFPSPFTEVYYTNHHPPLCHFCSSELESKEEKSWREGYYFLLKLPWWFLRWKFLTRHWNNFQTGAFQFCVKDTDMQHSVGTSFHVKYGYLDIQVSCRPKSLKCTTILCENYALQETVMQVFLCVWCEPAPDELAHLRCYYDCCLPTRLLHPQKRTDDKLIIIKHYSSEKESLRNIFNTQQFKTAIYLNFWENVNVHWPIGDPCQFLSVIANQ